MLLLAMRKCLHVFCASLQIFHRRATEDRELEKFEFRSFPLRNLHLCGKFPTVGLALPRCTKGVLFPLELFRPRVPSESRFFPDSRRKCYRRPRSASS